MLRLPSVTFHCGLVVTLLMGCGEPGDHRANTAEEQAASLVAALSQQFAQSVGDGLGEALLGEARFLGDDHVVYLDGFSPYLRLFDRDGTLLWSGAPEGGAPYEFHRPQALAAVDHQTAYVLQRGKLTVWVLDADTLAFRAAIPLPNHLAPLGAVSGCGHDLLVHALDERQVHSLLDPSIPSADSIDHLFSLSVDAVEEAEAVVEPWWSAASTRTQSYRIGHTSVLIGLADQTIAMLLRTHGHQAGEALLMDCDGRVLHRLSENALATGDGAEVQIPRTRALEWTVGIVAVPRGMIVAQQRYFHPDFHGVESEQWKTELFRYVDGAQLRSFVVPGQWVLMDRHEEHGILMASNDPVPHFIIVPEDVLMAEASDQRRLGSRVGWLRTGS